MKKLSLEAKYVYDIIESFLKDYEANPDLYTEAIDRQKGICKSYTKTTLSGSNLPHSVIIGIVKNRSVLYVDFVDHRAMDNIKSTNAKRPWFKGRKYHNSLIKRIRGVVDEMRTKDTRKEEEKLKEEFISNIRDALPGALNNVVDKVLIAGEDK